MVEYLRAKEIKTCIFAHNMTEVQSLRPLLRREEGEDDYVELEGRAVEEITYNLNMVTRKLNFEWEYRYSLIVGAECWNLLKAHSSLMQHFLLNAYYANCILAHGFTPQEKAEITQKLKHSYKRPHTLLSIGSSYSDLLF